MVVRFQHFLMEIERADGTDASFVALPACELRFRRNETTAECESVLLRELLGRKPPFARTGRARLIVCGGRRP
jgi:hypothetical protein